jgi:hypothetical protein
MKYFEMSVNYYINKKDWREIDFEKGKKMVDEQEREYRRSKSPTKRLICKNSVLSL